MAARLTMFCFFAVFLALLLSAFHCQRTYVYMFLAALPLLGFWHKFALSLALFVGGRSGWWGLT